MKKIAFVFVLFVAVAVANLANALHCSMWWQNPATNAMECMHWAPDPPPGFTTCTDNNPPTPGYAKFWTGTNGGGYCFQRAIPAGTTTVVPFGSNTMGDLDANGFHIRSVWFNLNRASTLYDSASLSGTALVVAAGSTCVSYVTSFDASSMALRN